MEEAGERKKRERDNREACGGAGLLGLFPLGVDEKGTGGEVW